MLINSQKFIGMWHTIVVVFLNLMSVKLKSIEKILKINQDFLDYTSTEIRQTKIIEKPPKFSIKKSLVRDAFFRKAVVHIYDSRCAFCRLKVTISLTQNIVDGAHIKPCAKFYDNRIDQGISFCKNHHWAFDRGLFTIGDNDKIIVSSNFQKESPNAKPIREFNGKSIVLPKLELYYNYIFLVEKPGNAIERMCLNHKLSQLV